MSDTHQKFFTLHLMELDGRLVNSNQRAELQAHLSTCAACRADLRLYERLHEQAGQRWAKAPVPDMLGKVLQDTRVRTRYHRVTRPVLALIWVGIALLVLYLIQFVFTSLRPLPAVQPVPMIATPKITPTTIVQEEGKTPVAPLLQGNPSGSGIWSPGGDYFFIPLVDVPPPGGDWRTVSLHFIPAATGEDCRASPTFINRQGSQNYGWVDNEHVLYIDKNGQAFLFTACQPGSMDLSDRFPEPLSRVALPSDLSDLVTQGPLLLEAPSAYWLMDPVTLQAHALAEPLPSPDLVDSFAWLPERQQIAVLQPVAGKPEMSHLWLLDGASGKVALSLEIEASNEGRAPFMELAGAERLMIWSLGSGGPLLIDLSLDPPKQVRVLPDLFGLDITYPDQISSIGVFFSLQDNSYHIVASINLPEDKSIYIYHGENGQVEKLPGDRHVMMILPGSQRMDIVPQDPPTIDDRYELVWVDALEQPPVDLQVSGHTPRNYQNLQSRLSPDGTRMLFGSTQGVSMVGLPGGETLAFWRLVGADNPLLLNLSLSPRGNALIAIALNSENPSQGNLIYWLAPVK
jgi:hypothetical protein